MKTPSGKHIIELDEEEIAFLNALNGILPAAPDFGRAVRRAVSEAIEVIAFDAIGVVRPLRAGPKITIFAVGRLGPGFQATVRAELERVALDTVAGQAGRSEIELEFVELPGKGRAAQAEDAGSRFVTVTEDDPRCCCGMFAAAEGVFQRKHQLLLSMVASWLRAYHSFSESYRQMEEMSYTDPLTGSYNRRKFNEEAAREVERARRYGYDLCLGMIDVDNLKQINDGHGHATGDTVLRLLGEAFGRRLRRVDLYARYGGDEFVVLLPHTPIAGAMLALGRVMKAADELVAEREAGRVKFSASVGIAACREGDDPETLLRRADGALYAAKRSGRGGIVIAD